MWRKQENRKRKEDMMFTLQEKTCFGKEVMFNKSFIRRKRNMNVLAVIGNWENAKTFAFA